ncbi:hypothetical protein BWQ96_06909 [Gracilariopsis chorda]|uniref:BZIP domain-containing protein n=1 Tax=Gracilariopsis chorda TaxID=448386 RepID=A0A2V3IMN9_9FLOR|nr:hypothetical protein BWQ96_06909 [Gracilariopsis chorda]|eukprot:PXF43346.1 hypothetical protein BWQ96_06909 [Gracilariopsis chorda]
MESDNLTQEDLRKQTDAEQNQFMDHAAAKARAMAEQDIPKPRRGCRFTLIERKKNNIACAQRTRRYKFYLMQILEKELERLSQDVENLEREEAAFTPDANRFDQLIAPPPAQTISPGYPALCVQDISNRPENIILCYADEDHNLHVDDFAYNEGFTDPCRDPWPPFWRP